MATELNSSKTRLGALCEQVQWHVGQITQLRRAVWACGHAVVARFVPEGRLQCSGLTVKRDAPSSLRAEFGGDFELLEHMTEAHQTPGGTIQQFVYCHCLMHWQAVR